MTKGLVGIRHQIGLSSKQHVMYFFDRIANLDLPKHCGIVDSKLVLVFCEQILVYG